MPHGAKPGESFVEILRHYSDARGDRTAYEFVGEGEVATTVTYAELWHEVSRIAARLQSSSMVGAPALLFYKPGLDFVRAFLACLCTGVIAVPVYLPTDAKGVEKVDAIIARAKPRGILSVSEIREQFASSGSPLAHAPWVLTDRLEGIAPNDEALRPAKRDELAFLQFTSGSTAAPKGVMVSHGNLLSNVALIGKAFATDRSDTHGVIWLPPYHDMGLIGGILAPVVDGIPVTLMSPMAFLKSPIAWLEMITRKRATASGGPNFAYLHCLRKVTEADLARLDLRSWRVAFCGAEPVQRETLASFAEVFAPAGFRYEAFLPCYGLAEATLFVSGGTRNKPAAALRLDLDAIDANRVEEAGPNARRVREVVSCGAIPPAVDVRIVDPETQSEVGSSAIGEVWVAGDGVARGYWDDENLTRETFDNVLPHSPARFLRTGDLGFVRDGELYVTGRRKELIIVRGRNLYPHDVEATVLRAHPALATGTAVAFSVEEDQEERLVVVHGMVPDAALDLGSLAAQIARDVTRDFDVAVHDVVFVHRKTLPLTTSGKPRRLECRGMYLSGRLRPSFSSRAAAPATARPPGAAGGATASPDELAQMPLATRERALLKAIKQAVSDLTRADPADLDSGQKIKELGLDSLQFVDLKLRIDELLGRDVSLDRFLECQTVGDVSRFAAHLLERPASLRPPSLTGMPAVSIDSLGRPAPGPRRSSDLLTAFVRDPYQFLVGLAAKYGDTVAFRLGSRPVMLFANPDDVQEILVKNATQFCKGDIYRVLGKLMGDGLVTTDTGESWRQQRRAAQPLFSKQTIGDYTASINARTARYVERWDQRAAAGEPVHVLSEMRRLSLEIVLGEFLGIEQFADFEEMFECIEVVEDGINIPSTFFTIEMGLDAEYQGTSRFLQAIERLDVLIYRVIDKHLEANDPREDFITLLAATELVRTHATSGDRATVKKALRDGVVSLIFAGMGTTSSSVFWTLYLLDQHPAVRERVERELDLALGGKPAGEAVMDDCPEFAAVISESLRLYPPIWWIDRQAIADTRIGEHFVAGGADIFISAYVIHRNPRIWPRPDAFEPERFRGAREAAFRTRGFLPFGLGRRACIGGQFSLHQMALVLSALLGRYRMRALHPGPLTLGATLSLVPREAVPFRFERRH